MSIAHLLDHIGRVWRYTETRDEYRAVKRTYAIVLEDLACASDGQTSVVVREGTGVTLGGSRYLYCDSVFTFQRDDVVEVHTGPTSPFKLLVDSWDNFRGHHIEIRGIEWDGKLEQVTTS